MPIIITLYREVKKKDYIYTFLIRLETRNTRVFEKKLILIRNIKFP